MSEGPIRLFIVMGVSGCGKSSIGTALADRISATYLESDALHPPKNIALMSAGTPLTDKERWPWLEIVADKMRSQGGLVVTGCSALRKSYRSFLADRAGERIWFIHLSGSMELIARRMESRSDHFMPLQLLQSQFATLEPPDSSEPAMTVDISGSQGDIVQTIIEALLKENLMSETVACEPRHRNPG